MEIFCPHFHTRSVVIVVVMKPRRYSGRTLGVYVVPELFIDEYLSARDSLVNVFILYTGPQGL